MASKLFCSFMPKGMSIPQRRRRFKMKSLALVRNENFEEGVTPASTRKDRRARRELDKRKTTLEEAEKIRVAGKPVTYQEKWVLAQADKIVLQDMLQRLEEEQEKIRGLLGDFKGQEDESGFVADFISNFECYSFSCRVEPCRKEDAKWILPLAISVGKAATAKGREQDIPKRENHSAQWELAVELFRVPEDLEGLVYCDTCKPRVQKFLEEKNPQDDPRNHRLYHLDGFVKQLGMNRHRLLREDLNRAEEETLETMSELEDVEKKIEYLNSAMKKEEELDRAIMDSLL